MHIMNVKCNDRESFKYSILVYLYYYNIKTNKTRVSQIKNNINPYIYIKFNRDNDIYQFEKENNHINLVINNIFGRSMFTSRNSAPIKVTIVKTDDRYAIVKPSKQCFNDNINAINEINSNNIKLYKLTDKIKQDLILDPLIIKNM